MENKLIMKNNLFQQQKIIFINSINKNVTRCNNLHMIIQVSIIKYVL